MKRIIRLPEVVKKTGLSRSSIYAYMNEGRFPKSFDLGERSKGWLENSIDQWIDSKIKDNGGLNDKQ